MTLYIKTTDDEYELPVAVGESIADLARQLKVSCSVISHGINKTRKGISPILLVSDGLTP